jgi:hypothetical protein
MAFESGISEYLRGGAAASEDGGEELFFTEGSITETMSLTYQQPNSGLFCKDRTKDRDNEKIGANSIFNTVDCNRIPLLRLVQRI